MLPLRLSRDDPNALHSAFLFKVDDVTIPQVKMLTEYMNSEKHISVSFPGSPNSSQLVD